MSYYKIYKGRKLGPYEYKRPKHFFTVQDLSRISKKLVKSNRASPIEIVAIVATSVGLGFLICKAAKSYRRITNIFDFITAQATTFSIAYGINILLQYFLQSPFLKIPLINKISYAVIAILFFVLKIFEAADSFKEDIIFIHKTVDVLEKGCDFVKHYAAKTNIFDGDEGVFNDLKEKVGDYDFDYDFEDLKNRLDGIGDLTEKINLFEDA
ncbi:MAG: hypothetical protein K9K84_11640 [Methylovulum sp.]|nr:hypothetical protein [Methylovulum sp.]